MDAKDKTTKEPLVSIVDGDVSVTAASSLSDLERDFSGGTLARALRAHTKSILFSLLLC